MPRRFSLLVAFVFAASTGCLSASSPGRTGGGAHGPGVGTGVAIGVGVTVVAVVVAGVLAANAVGNVEPPDLSCGGCGYGGDE